MKLYYHPLSAFSRKVLVAFYEKELNFTPEVVNLFDPAVKAQYKKEINPFGKVPYLQLEAQDWSIPESSIIIEYADTHFDSGTQLISKDPDLARQARFSDRIGDLYLLDPAVYVLLQHLFLPEDQRNHKEIASKTQKFTETLGLLNQYIGEKPYLLGDSFGMADISASVGCQLIRDMLQVPLNDWPNLSRWLESCLSRESWQKVLAEVSAFQQTMANQ